MTNAQDCYGGFSLSQSERLLWKSTEDRGAVVRACFRDWKYQQIPSLKIDGYR